MSVISLKPTALEEALQRSAVILAYAPWCGHCVKLMPVYESFGDSAATTLPGVLVTRINYHKYGEEVKSNHIGNKLIAGGVGQYVRGFPTILFVHDGKMSVYTGDRTVAGLEGGFRDFQNDNGDIPNDIPSISNDAVQHDTAHEELLSVDEPPSIQPHKAIELDPEGLANVAKDNAFVLLYAPWCKHCQDVMQPFDEVAQNLAPAEIRVAKIDFEKYGKEITARQIGVDALATKGYDQGVSSVVRSFPTILMFANNEIGMYTGPRTSANMSKAMAEWVQQFST